MAIKKGWILRYTVFILTVILFCSIIINDLYAQTKSAYLIVVDPAHGGEDTGVISDKLREKDLTMNLALTIQQEALKTPGFRIQLTRSADRQISIAERISIVDMTKADCLISLHTNAGFGKTATGYEIYFPGFRQLVAEGGDSTPILKDMTRNTSLNNSVRLARTIQSSLETIFNRKGRGLRDAPSPLLDDLNIPGIVVEIGFATHTEDRKKLTEPEMQRAIARSMVKGLKEYLQKAGR